MVQVSLRVSSGALRRLLIVLSTTLLLAARVPAQYTVTITGGTYTSSGAQPTVTGNDVNGVGGANTGGGYTSGGQIHILAGAGAASCQGAMQAHLHWTGAVGAEPPVLVVKEAATAAWSGDSGDCDPGLPHVVTTSSSSTGVVKSGVRYTVITSPGADLDLQHPPRRTSSATGSRAARTACAGGVPRAPAPSPTRRWSAAASLCSTPSRPRR